MSEETRIERDTMGEVAVPSGALWGAATQRALENFPVSGERLDPAMIHAYGLIKTAAARANAELGALPRELADLIVRAASEVAQGRLDEHFQVDVFQTGSGTSTNMNVNEVVANRCSQLAGEPTGSFRPVHPNDHVNCSQSSNDTFPTAIHLAATVLMRDELVPALQALRGALAEKADEFREVHKIGRTHLMDATPLRLGEEFGGYARQAELAAERVSKAMAALGELPLGGTAVGSGMNCPAGFAARAIELINEGSGTSFREAADHFEAQAAKDALVEASGQLRTVATGLWKIANDIRLLGSGPRCGLGELSLPPVQPGSSIMPGKVNPVMAESVMQVCAQVIGNDTAVVWGATGGNLELNTMMPMMAQNLLRSVRLLAKVSSLFRTRCLVGIEANRERCEELIERSMSLAASLVPALGYERAAEIAKRAAAEGRTVREICEEEKALPAAELDRLLSPSGGRE